MQNQEKDIDFEKVKKQIERICHFITHHREHFKNNEEQVKTSLVLPLLRKLGWDDSNPLEVSFEARTSDGGRIDILLIGKNNSKFLIEVKNLSKNLKDYIDQFGRYAFNRGIPCGALTNGQKWICLKSFEPNTNLKDRIIIEIDLCEDNLLKIYAVLSCLTKAKTEEFEKCVKNNLTSICIQIENLKGKISKTFKCNSEICNILLSFCENYFSSLKEDFECFQPDEVNTDSSTATADQGHTSSNTYKVLIGNLSIEANTRPKLMKKILELAFSRNWLTTADLPILNNHHNPVISLSPISGANVVKWNIQGKTIYVHLGSSGVTHQARIKQLLEKIKEKTKLPYQIINL
jgi:predicted type IV restriction endonuclease